MNEKDAAHKSVLHLSDVSFELTQNIFLYNNRVTLKNRWLLWHDTETKLLSKYYVSIASKNKIPTFLPPSNPAYLVPPNPLFGQSIDVIFQEALNNPSIKKSLEQTKDIFKKYRLGKENPTPQK